MGSGCAWGRHRQGRAELSSSPGSRRVPRAPRQSLVPPIATFAIFATAAHAAGGDGEQAGVRWYLGCAA